MRRSLSVLGATGSVGRQTLEVAEALGFPVTALTAHRSAARLEEQARRFRPELAVCVDPAAAAELRLRLVREGTADLPNVRAYPGGDYLISPATFPAYFLKDQARAPEAKCDLDLTLFGSAIAPALHITERFVGQEPTCAVTAQYNRRMQAILPAYGIHVTEIPRLSAISATTVRARLQEGDLAAVRALVPKTTYEACRSLFGAGAPCP